MGKGTFSRLLKGRFTVNYMFIYLLCILCLCEVLGTFFLWVGGDRSWSLSDLLLGVESYDVHLAGLGRSLFWTMASGVPLAAYALFARTLPFGRSMLALLLCVCMSAVPVLVYALVVRANEGYPDVGDPWDYAFAIMACVSYVHIAIDLAVRRHREKSGYYEW